MYWVKDIFINVNDIRKIHYETDNFDGYLVITYAYDDEHPTKICVSSHEEYVDIARDIVDYIRSRESK